jgi:predicted nuclease of predicted toxin-antitoxin system
MIWLVAHLPPALAGWLATETGQPAAHLRDLGLRHAKDKEIFSAARQAGAILMTKDADFVEMVLRLGPPPAIVWLTCGNTSNDSLRILLKSTIAHALRLIDRGESLVEITDAGLADFYLDDWPTLAWSCGFDFSPESLYTRATGKDLPWLREKVAIAA